MPRSISLCLCVLLLGTSCGERRAKASSLIDHMQEAHERQEQLHREQLQELVALVLQAGYDQACLRWELSKARLREQVLREVAAQRDHLQQRAREGMQQAHDGDLQRLHDDIDHYRQRAALGDLTATELLRDRQASLAAVVALIHRNLDAIDADLAKQLEGIRETLLQQVDARPLPAELATYDADAAARSLLATMPASASSTAMRHGYEALAAYVNSESGIRFFVKGLIPDNSVFRALQGSIDAGLVALRGHADTAIAAGQQWLTEQLRTTWDGIAAPMTSRSATNTEGR